MTRYVDAQTFVANAAETMSFLVEAGFVLSDRDHGRYRVAYQCASFGIDVMYDDRDGRVVTVVNGFARDIDVHASLTCLFVAAKLGPAQQIKEIARSRKRLPIVLDSQARAIQALLPVLAGAHRERLLLECHGR